MLLLQVPAGLWSVATMFVLRRSATSYDKMRSDFHLDTDITSCPQVGGGGEGEGEGEGQYRRVRRHTEPVRPRLAQFCCMSPSHIDIFVMTLLLLLLVCV